MKDHASKRTAAKSVARRNSLVHHATQYWRVVDGIDGLYLRSHGTCLEVREIQPRDEAEFVILLRMRRGSSAPHEVYAVLWGWTISLDCHLTLTRQLTIYMSHCSEI